MNTLTDPLKRIARDLVDSKLWPVAVLLLVALVALPVLIGGGSSTDSTAAPVAPTAAAVDGPGAGLITVADPAAGGKETRPGRIRDPFYDPPEPPAAEVASAPSPAASGASPAASAPSPAASAASPGGSAGAPKGGGTPATATPPAHATPPQTTPAQPTKSAKSVHYRTVVRWYTADAGVARPLARLTPLGGRAAPLALYLGVTKSKSSYAVFLLAPNATSEGDAECEQSDCRVIGLKAGQSQRVTMPSPDGGEARRYHLEVVSVKAITADAGAAARMRARVHSDGRDVMREMWQHRPTAEALEPIRYDRDRGLLFRTPAAKASK